MRRIIVFALLVAVICSVSQISYAQYEVRGDLDMVLRNNSTTDITNIVYLHFSSFDFLRARLFFDAKISDHATVLTQLLFDNERIQFYGGYLRVDNMFGKKLGMNVGMIPVPVGNWGPRVYSYKNPVIGEPLLYHYFSALSTAYFQTSKAALYAKRAEGYTVYGLPMLFETWWGTGIEVYGSVKKIDWSVGALTGSLSAPTVQREKDIPQMTGKFGVVFSPEFTATVAAFAGPYMTNYPDINSPGPKKDAARYLNLGSGLSLQYAKGYLEMFSEGFVERWQHPYLGNLDAFSGYVDAKYKFAPQWYVAGRVETMRFSKIDFGGDIGKQNWDIPLNRFELGVGYKFNQSILLKFVGQIVRYREEPDEYNDEEVALQLSTRI